MSDLSLHFFAEIFESLWPLSNVKLGEVLQQTGDRMTRVILADEGVFVFKVASSKTSESDIIRDTFAFQFLKDRNFLHIPTLLKTRIGGNYRRVQDRFVYVMAYVKGKNEERSPERWAQLANLVAELHDISDYPYASSFTVPSALAELEARVSDLPFYEAFMDVVQGLPNFEGLSRSVIHTDLGLENTIVQPDGTMILVDLDDVGVGTTILDLGYPLICIFVDGNEFERENATAFYNAYFSKRTLPDGERALVFEAGLFFALLYAPFGDTNRKWQRIQFALKNRDLISSVLQ